MSKETYNGEDEKFFGIKNGESTDEMLTKLKNGIVLSLRSRGITIETFDYNAHNGDVRAELSNGSAYEFTEVRRARPKPPVEEPETPIEEPETPIEEPETPVEEPEVPELEIYPVTPPFPLPANAKFYKDVAYGEDARQKLDAFLPHSNKPTGVVVFIHGGGFISGSKEYFYSGMPKDIITDLINKGQAVVSINYRFISIKGETEGLKKCFNDAILAVEFLKENRQLLNIEKDNVVMVGASSGAGLAMLVGYSSDVKVKGVLALEAQAGYDVPEWDRNIFSSLKNFTQSNINSIAGNSTLLAVYGATKLSDLETPEYIEYRNDVAILNDLKEGSPELYLMSYLIGASTPKNVQELYHHPFHAKTLYDKALSNGMKVKLLLPQMLIDKTKGEALNDFIVRKLTE